MRLQILGILILFSSYITANTVSQKAMLQDLEAAKKILLVKYAPLEWKKESIGLNIENSFKKAKERIQTENLKTDRDFQKIFKEFLKSTQDYHVNAFFYSSSWAFFPLQVKFVQERCIVTSLEGSIHLVGPEVLFFPKESDDVKSDEKMEDLKPGNEIIAMNGVPIKIVIEKIIDNDLCGDRSPTGYALAERMLFFRRGKYSENVPSGTFELTVQMEEYDIPITLTLPWFHTREWVEDLAVKSAFDHLPIAGVKQHKIPRQSSKELFSQFLSRNFTVRFAQEIIGQTPIDPNDKIEDVDMRHKGVLPPIGKILWESEQDKSIYAYLALNEFGDRVGYIYLPTFDREGGFADSMIEELLEALTCFNKDADALVVDITNNPGGNLCYMYAILSLLSNQPLQVPTHKETILQEDVYLAALLYNITDFLELELNEPTEPLTRDGYPMTKLLLEQSKQYAQVILDTWKAGRTMTEPCFLLGIDKILPHPQLQYTKPLVVLTNELCFSCGDMFPAILQDNKRALIFGKKTAGAGGCVIENPFTSQFGIRSFSLTKSIAYRANGMPIENIGVSPDIAYELTLSDLQNNYVDYIHALNHTIDGVLNAE